jgi:hypothetical protein
VRIERGLVVDGQPARQATVRPRSVSCCWQNVGRESLGGSGGEGRTMAQLHVTPHRAARSLSEMWKGVVLSAPHPFHTIRVVCGVVEACGRRAQARPPYLSLL